MSRYGDGDSDDGADYNNAYELWQHNLKLALTSPRGLKALTELREALLALPEKRLIARALCTVGVPAKVAREAELASGKRHDTYGEFHDLNALVGEQGEGVCAVGAYIWWKNVKAGMSAEQSFATLPVLADFDHDMWETAGAAKAVGMAGVLAWELAYRNDETFGNCTPEERYVRYLAWLDERIATASKGK